jgi:hypothetical protein
MQRYTRVVFRRPGNPFAVVAFESASKPVWSKGEYAHG